MLNRYDEVANAIKPLRQQYMPKHIAKQLKHMER